LNESTELRNNTFDSEVIPLVSIDCITYNHKQYIRDAIEGFLSQRTNFPIEILIHDDASTDGTTEIIKEYEKRYPNLIKPLYEEENQWVKGRRGSPVFNIPRAQGKYIAFCEGDDYWIDPYKLQKQVDFLESHPDYGICITNYNKYIQKTGNWQRKCFPEYKYPTEVNYEEYLFDRTSIATATVLLKKDFILKYMQDIPEVVRKNWFVGDTPLWLYVMLKVKFKYIPDVTAVYRINENSLSKYTDTDELYNYILKGYDIPFYFTQVLAPNSILYDKLMDNYHQMYLRYRYLARSKEIGDSSYRYLKMKKKLNFENYIQYWCSSGPLSLFTDLLILPCYNLLRRGRKYLIKKYKSEYRKYYKLR